MSVLASVVVPTFRRDELLARCIRRLQQQNLDPQQYEIVVADDGVSEATRRLVGALRSAGGPALRYVPVTAAHGPAAARNVGWRAACGPIIAFTDDDCLPEADWLAAGLKAMADASADAATGQTLVPLPERPTDHDRDTSGLAQATFITANCFCRRQTLEEIGGFDERFTAAWREDSDLHFALLERGRQIVRATNAVVVHPVRPAPWGVSLRLQQRGRFDPLLYRKHPRLYRQHIAAMPRWYYWAIAALAAAAFGASVRQPLLGLGAAGLWLVLTGRFVLRRLGGNSWAPRHVAEMVVTSAIIPLLSVYWRLRGWLRHRVFYV
jgi:GT2 family glycosyltransferase